MLTKPAVLVLALTLALAGMSVETAAQQALPDAIAVPGAATLVTLRAVGAQIYECKAGADGKLAWTFREPLATLIAGGKTVGRHYAGPAWELADGSLVVGKLAAQAPGTTAQDIPWLRLDVASRRGTGELSATTAIQRINTKGGVMSGACDSAGGYLSVPYAADYVFLKSAS